MGCKIVAEGTLHYAGGVSINAKFTAKDISELERLGVDTSELTFKHNECSKCHTSYDNGLDAEFCCVNTF